MRKPLKLKKLVNFKVSPRDKRRLQANADHYTDGDVSKWIRIVATDPRFLESNRIRIRLPFKAA